MIRSRAEQYAESVLEYMRGTAGIGVIDVAGSFRRKCETVGDLDILATSTRPAAISRAFVAYPAKHRVLAHGDTRSTIVLAGGLHIDLRVLAPRDYGAGLLYFTGSKAHNIALRRIAQSAGMKLSEYGLFRGTRKVASRTEEEIYSRLGLPYIEPELREDRGEIEAARRKALPHLVEQRHIRGDLQCHTTDSDGRDSLERMAEAAEEMGYEYLAITDHSPGVGVAGGLDAAGFRKQRKRIERLNSRLRKLTILCGAEIDVRKDGSLDLPDSALRGLDIVVAAIHTYFGLGREEQTQRLIRAVGNPSVDVLAHPTGRLIGKRRGIDIDLERVCGAAADNGVMMEVNGQPERLDLDDVALRAATQKGVRLTFGSDAHSQSELGFIRYALDQARRGWATASNVANTLTLTQLSKLLHGSR
jgi:DNA polymerase (family 10)